MLENENNYILSLQTNFVNYLTNLISKNLFYFRILNNEYEIVVLPITLPKILNIYKNHTHLYFKQLIEIAVIDRLTQIDRFKINYILFSQVFNTRLILSIEVNEINNVFSITEFFNSAE
jgi:NADH:ubiquinone oxidoreductase subunit C